MLLISTLQAHAQVHWSAWTPLGKSDTKKAGDERVLYRTRYEVSALSAPGDSVCFVQIRDDLRHGRMSNISLRILYIVESNGRSAGKLMEPTVTLTNSADAVVLRHANCLSVGNIDLIDVNRR